MGQGTVVGVQSWGQSWGCNRGGGGIGRDHVETL